MPQPAEDPGDLEVALHSGEIEPAAEPPPVGADEAASDRKVMPGVGPVRDSALGPADVDVSQQTDEVVGDRTRHCVLEVDHARVAPVEVHEIARVVVAMDEHLRLLGADPEQRLDRLAERARKNAAELDPEVAREEPLPEESHFIAQLAFIVRGHPLATDAALHVEQRLERIGVEGVGVAVVDHVEVAARSEIVEQHKAAFHVRRMQRGRVDAGPAQQTEHRHERSAVFHRRRCVHRDPRPRAGAYPEVAPKARILGCGLEPEIGGVEGVAQPRRERRAARIESVGVRHRPGILEPCRSLQVSQVSESGFPSEGTRLRRARGAGRLAPRRGAMHASSA